MAMKGTITKKNMTAAVTASTITVAEECWHTHKENSAVAVTATTITVRNGSWQKTLKGQTTNMLTAPKNAQTALLRLTHANITSP